MFNNSLDDNQLLSSIIDLGRTQGTGIISKVKHSDEKHQIFDRQRRE